MNTLGGSIDLGLRELFSSVQASRLASAIGGSITLTALLSGIHLIGMTLLVGSAVVSGLSLLGLAFREWPLRDVARDGARGILVGVLISATSGVLLLLPRIENASDNAIFRTKMLLLCAAVAFHLVVYRSAIGAHSRSLPRSPLAGAIGLALWFGVAVAGCAFILLE